MSTKLAYRNGGQTSEEGLSRASTKSFTTEGVLGASDLLVTAAATPDNTVKVSVGEAVIGTNSPSLLAAPYYYFAWVSVQDSVTIAANGSGNPRIDAVVAYIDLSVQSAAFADNPGALKLLAVQGTAAATPAAPSDATVQAAVGSGNPWLLLAAVAVSNGFTSIVGANITDCRPLADTRARGAAQFADFVASGLAWSAGTGLSASMTGGYAYVGGAGVPKPPLSHAFPASQDTYVDLLATAKPTATDDLSYTSVANGAAAPALAASAIRLAKVVTGGSAVTSVTTSGYDSNGVLIRNTGPVSASRVAAEPWTVFAPAPTGFSGTPNVGTARGQKFGTRADVRLEIDGTSNGTGFTVQLPWPAKSGGRLATVPILNNGTWTLTGLLSTAAGSATATLGTDANGAGFTASGTKGVDCGFSYETLT